MIFSAIRLFSLLLSASPGFAYFVWHSQGEEKFKGGGCRIVCSQHKCGTFNLLQAVDSYFKSTPSLHEEGAKLEECLQGDVAFFLNIESMQNGVNFDYGKARGVLMIRHPLDVLVSNHRFHLMSKESWLHAKQENGLTYQEELQSMNKSAGIMHELTKGTAYQDTKRLLEFIKSPEAYYLHRLKLETSKYSPLEFAKQLSVALGFDEETVRPIITEELAYEKFLQYKHLSPVDSDLVEDINHQLLHGANYPYEFGLHLECAHYEKFEEIFGLKALRQLGYGDSIEMYKNAKLQQCGYETIKKRRKKISAGAKKKKKRSRERNLVSLSSSMTSFAINGETSLLEEEVEVQLTR